MFRQVLKLLGVLVLAGFLYIGFTRQATPDTSDGRIHIAYWEKWTGMEADAMRAVVDEFNASQDRIFVDMLTISQIDRKLLLATAGGVPPDIVGLWSDNLAVFADRHVLMELDEPLAEYGITRDQYIPAYWDLCEYRGHMHALPTTPGALALHWNKQMFREAGLDPERPPRTIEELDEFSDRLTIRDENGKLERMGFIPTEPGWWNWAWGYYFGGHLWNGKDQLTPDAPENIRAYEWARKYSEEYGVNTVQTFQSGFGNFSSPQNAFLSGEVAMVIQGVWMNNYISKYTPDLEWGAAPFPYPADRPDLADVAYVDCDIIAIPVGCKHVPEALEFLRFVSSRKGMEMLCMGQRKHTPLAEVSDEFLANHPNPYIQVFIDVAKREHTFASPKTPVWSEYSNEIEAEFDEIWLLRKTPEEALKTVRLRMQPKLDRRLERRALAGLDQ
ncbi:MAG: ABC transporter substrate-binding protein [Armatimonadetes bacterium]|nr:ABC transporter substrate-binding protein [Armatimonadota bacterium]